MRFFRFAGAVLALAIASTASADNNWGRWGSDDELGTLNYITPEVRKAAAASVKSGKTFNLAIDLQTDKPGWPGRTFRHGVKYVQHGLAKGGGGVGAADDYAFLDLQVSTQWDGFAHLFYDGAMYNGVPSTAVTEAGAARLSIHAWADHFVTRGILLDIARFKGVPHLKKGYIITPEDIEGAAAAQGVEIRSGDCLLFRTGWMRKLNAHTWPMKDIAEALDFGEPGVGYAATQWLKTKEIACIAVDNLGVEPIPFDPAGLDAIIEKGPPLFPIHVELLRNQGMPIGELFNLEALARDSAEDGQYDFLFIAPPLRVVGGIGSPLSPIAVK